MSSVRNTVRWTSAALLLVLSAFVTVEMSQAIYMRPDLVNVPVERLTKNLEEQLAKNPKDAQALLNLARLHGMAYALKTDTAQIQRGKETTGAWFDFEPKHVPFRTVPTGDPDKLKAAKEHLDKAIKRYAEVLELTPDNLTAGLGHAWCIEQSGDKDKAIGAYRKVIEAAWAKEKDMRRAPLGWHSVTAEAAGYLVPKLDPDKDKDEIAILKNRTDLMERVPRPITPIVVPLVDGLTANDLEDRSACVAFDADGTGLQKRWTWITKDAGWLVYDPHKTGRVTSALQMFGGVSFWMFWENGYQALAALDDNGDGELTGSELHGLAIWQDRNGNGVCDPGEVRPLAEWGIVALSCRYERDGNHPERIAYSSAGVQFRNGTTRATYDLILQPK